MAADKRMLRLCVTLTVLSCSFAAADPGGGGLVPEYAMPDDFHRPEDPTIHRDVKNVEDSAGLRNATALEGPVVPVVATPATLEGGLSPEYSLPKGWPGHPENSPPVVVHDDDNDNGDEDTDNDNGNEDNDNNPAINSTDTIKDNTVLVMVEAVAPWYESSTIKVGASFFIGVVVGLAICLCGRMIRKSCIYSLRQAKVDRNTSLDEVVIPKPLTEKQALEMDMIRAQ